ncbi:MAG: GNAT family N-acetyltransferase [Paracoccaceae bacterium]
MTGFDIPTLHSDRLILRAPRLGDEAAIARFGASGRTTYTGGAFPEADAWKILLRISGHWHIRGYGMWMITRRGDDDTALGWCGGIYHTDWPEPELGWSLFDDATEGHGIAHEAALCARVALAQTYGLIAPISIMDPDNHRSVALAKRMGAAKAYEVSLRGHLCHIYRHPDVRADAGQTP